MNYNTSQDNNFTTFKLRNIQFKINESILPYFSVKLLQYSR